MSLSNKMFLTVLNKSFLLKPRWFAGSIGCNCRHIHKKPFSPLSNPEVLKHEPNYFPDDSLKSRKTIAPSNFRFTYPEFLPDPDVKKRNFLREKLERADMVNRRKVIDLPEFYVGSVLSVVTSDPHSQGKTSKFVGLCIKRVGCGLRAEFTLRNVIDHQGIEVRYQLYDPTIQQIQVLKLEKRLDDKLYYLRDAPEEYSTIPLDMEPEILPEGAEVPINKIKIELKPRPWVQKWWLHDLKGVVGLEKHLRGKDAKKRDIFLKPWDKYDLMKQYRETIPEQEQNEIWADVYSQLHQLQIMRKKMSRARSFIFPKKNF